MSHTNDRKKYVTLEDVRVSYKPKDDTIHITSTDPDVQAGGFHLSLSKGTQTEVTLRELLRTSGVIRPTPVFKSQKGKARIISLTTGQEGSGIAKFALGLAGAIAETDLRGFLQSQLKTLVIDMDWHNPSIGFEMGGVTSPTVLNSYIKSQNKEVSYKNSVLRNHTHGYDVLLAPQRAPKAEKIPGGFYVDIIEKASHEYDVIILVTPLLGSQYKAYQQVALENSDYVVYFAESKMNSHHTMSEWLTQLTSMEIETMKIGVLLDRLISSEVPYVMQSSMQRDLANYFGVDALGAISAAGSKEKTQQAYQEVGDVLLWKVMTSA